MGTDTLVRPLDFAPADIQTKAASVTMEDRVGVLPTEDPREFWIIGGVTGIVDEVDDIVEPGAYAATLAERTPKIIKDHDWTHRLGKVLEIFEAMPGDKRLPATTARGSAWPAEAGALMAKVRLFNTPEGQAAAERWREEGVEQEFSIGYVATKTKKDGQGRRHISVLKCFEISDVLWGAMPLAGPLPMGLATKMLSGLLEEAKDLAPGEVDLFAEAALTDIPPANVASTDTLPVDAAPADAAPVAPAAAAPVAPVDAAPVAPADAAPVAPAGAPLFDAAPADAAPADAAATDPLTGPDNFDQYADTSPELEQWADGLGDDYAVDDNTPEMKTALAAFAAVMEGKYDTSPVGTPGGRQNWVDKAGGLPKFIRAISHALIRQGKSKSNAIQIAIGTVRRWAAGGGKVSEKTRTKAAEAVAEFEAKRASSHASKGAAGLLDDLEGGGLRMERDVRIKAYDPQAEEGPDAGLHPVDEDAPAGLTPFDEVETGDSRALMPQDEIIESKMYGQCLPGSYQERQQMVQHAAWESLRGPERDTYTETGEGTRYTYDSVDVVALWDDRVVVTAYDWSNGGDAGHQSFEMPYVIRGGQAFLGQPDEVRLVVSTVVEKHTGGEEDVALPFAADLTEVAMAMKVMLAGVETKAGRVLSGANESRLRSAMENLLGVLAAAGVQITPPKADATTGPPVGDMPAGAPTGAVPVAAKDLRGGEVFDASTLPTPEEYLKGLSTFLDVHGAR